MKKCQQCGELYEDGSMNFCPRDHQPLVVDDATEMTPDSPQAVAETTTVTSQTETPAQPGGGFNPWKIAAASLLSLVVLFGALYVFLHKRTSAEVKEPESLLKSDPNSVAVETLPIPNGENEKNLPVSFAPMPLATIQGSTNKSTQHAGAASIINQDYTAFPSPQDVNPANNDAPAANGKRSSLEETTPRSESKNGGAIEKDVPEAHVVAAPNEPKSKQPPKVSPPKANAAITPKSPQTPDQE